MKLKKIRDEQKGMIFILIIVFLLVATILFFSISLKTDPVRDSIKNNEIIRCLYVVEDEDSSLFFSNVLIYYPKNNKGAVVNMPANTGSIYQTLGRVDRLADVYSESGIMGFKVEVEKLLGISIPYYTVFTHDNFIKISDYLGGMRVFIPAPVDVTSENGERWLLPSGALNLDGDKIATYVHYRTPDDTDSDFEDRYLNVMVAFLTGFHEKRSVIFYKNNFNKFAECMQSNLELKDLRTVYAAVADIDTESIARQTVTGSVRTVDGQLLLFPLNNGEFIKEAVKQTTSMLLSNDGMVPSRGYVLEIQNGTTVQGLARNTSILFQNANYDVLSAINADSNDYEHTVIIDYVGNDEIARLIGDFIHCTNIRREENKRNGYNENGDSEANVDFTIILGRDFDGRYVKKSSR